LKSKEKAPADYLEYSLYSLPHSHFSQKYVVAAIDTLNPAKNVLLGLFLLVWPTKWAQILSDFLGNFT
jgi:hypothetical protein